MLIGACALIVSNMVKLLINLPYEDFVTHELNKVQVNLAISKFKGVVERCPILFSRYSSFRQIGSTKNSFLMLATLILLQSVCYIGFPLSFIVSVVSVEDVHYFYHYICYTRYSSFRQIGSTKNSLKMLVTYCYSPLY